MTLLITACSKDKCATLAMSAAVLGSGTADELARDWISKLCASDDRLEAGKRYIGRGHRRASAAAQRYGASHLIMSAGLGFVRPGDEIPPYRLTLKRSEEDSILPHLAPPAEVSNWWEAIERHSPWARRLSVEWDGRSLILIALPLDYLQILPAQLERLPAAAKRMLRLISGAAAAALPVSLRAYHLPYDRRLDGPDSTNPGTGSDFLGRAAAHFLGLLKSSDDSDGGIDSHKEMVENALGSMRPAERRQGRSLPDDAITAILRSELANATLGSNQLLRRFRDELGIACEQSRFKRLYAGVRAERALA